MVISGHTGTGSTTGQLRHISKGKQLPLPRQEIPAADDASPAAVGKLFFEQM